MLYITLLLVPLLIGPILNNSIEAQEQDTNKSLFNPRTIATSRRWQTSDQDKKHLHLQNRRAAPFAQNCSTYYSANTNHAVCNGDRSIMCLSGCTGGIIAQNCKSNSTSPPTTQTCSVAFSQTSETSFLCNTPTGAYTCEGPSSGSIACEDCVPTPTGVVPSNSSLIVNGTSMTGEPESHVSTGQNQQDSSATSHRLSNVGPETTFFIIFPAVSICLWLH